MSFNITSDGSPTPRKGASRFSMTAGDLRIDTSPEALGQAVGNMSLNQYPFAYQRAFGSPLTSNMQNMKRPLGSSTLSSQSLVQHHSAYDGYKKPKMDAHEESSVMDSLMQRLNGRSPPHDPYSSSSGSVPITPATDEFASTPPTDMDNSVILVEAGELQKLKLELQEARNEVHRVNQEMHSQHVARSTMEHLSQSSETDYTYPGDVTEQTLTTLQNKFNASTRSNYGWGNEPTRTGSTTTTTRTDKLPSQRLPERAHALSARPELP
ncbi:Pumilio-family RNA binding repeat domain containing protein [Pyrenophora tritici-repentis]|nr:Pumilio-family RNA binding repeat domain containing protein [Pyrenophora tritici-repentis]